MKQTITIRVALIEAQILTELDAQQGDERNAVAEAEEVMKNLLNQSWFSATEQALLRKCGKIS